MIEEKFQKIMKSNTGCAVVMAGSGSDEEHIDKIADSLNAFEIPFEVAICSAHKQPDTLLEIIKDYNAVGGSVTYVAVAGGTDALSGTLSFHALGPVISCPPDSPNASVVTNPPGSSNSYIPKPGNVGKHIAQMYAGVNPVFREILETKNVAKIESLVVDNTKFNQNYGVHKK